MENYLKDLFIPYESAQELKELWFDEPCLAFLDAYNGSTHLFFKLRTKYAWLLRLYCFLTSKEEKQVVDVSQGDIEYLEGDNAVLAPTWEQAFKWLRKNYKLSPIISQFGYAIEDDHGTMIYTISDDEDFSSYEQTREECLKKLIEIVRDGKY